MGLERYLCVGGIEIANPNRTLAYLRRLGNACLPTPPGDGCCTCHHWSPPTECSTSITFGFEVNPADPDGRCISIHSPTDGFGAYIGMLGFITFDVCTGEDRPELPPMSDPAWTLYGPIPIPANTVEVGGCINPGTSPGPGGGDQCGFQMFEFTSSITGAVITLVVYIDGSGDEVVVHMSGDGGATWYTEPGEHTVTIVGTCGAGAGSHEVRFLASADDAQACYGLITVTNLTGPILVSQRIYADPAPTVGTLPDASDPGWVSTGPPAPGTVPFTPIGGCWEWDPVAGNYIGTPPDGWYELTIEDLGTGEILTLINGTAYSTWAPGSAPSLVTVDGGATWTDTVLGMQSVTVYGPTGPGEFSTPALDDAPWFDPAVPASGDVLGVWLEEVRLGTSHQRQARPRASWGTTLGTTTRPGRELTLVGWVYARSEAGTAYARQWLYEALNGESCDTGACDLPTAELWTHCDEEGTGQRFLPRVGLTSWDPEVEPEFPRACGFKFEAVLTSEVPSLITAPFSGGRTNLMAGEEACNICTPCPEPDPRPMTCGCLATPIREAPAPQRTECFCSPIVVRRTFTTVTAPRYWSDAVAIITVDSGDPDDDGPRELHNLRIRGWANPVGVPAPTDGSNPWECMEPCIDVEVSCIPERGRLVIDGATRRATLTADGRSISAHGYLSSNDGRRFSWPEVSCHGLVLCVDADAYRTPAGATATLEFVTRERG